MNNPLTIEQEAEARKRTLGRNVERMMDERRMSFGDLARATGVTKSALFKIVDGKVDSRASTLLALSHVFGCTLDALYAPSNDQRET